MAKRKLTLDDAIRSAKVKVELDENCITIEKEDPLRGVDSTKIGEFAIDHMHDEDHNLNYQAKFWKRKCEQLSNERALLEKQLVDKIGVIVNKYDDLRSYSQLLEDKYENAPSVDAMNTMSSALATATAKIALYEMMTAMSVEIKEDREYVCTMKNPLARKAARFKIRQVKTSEGDLAVEPRANLRFLPEYLQQGEIICESSTAPMFMCDVISSLFDTGGSSSGRGSGDEGDSP